MNINLPYSQTKENDPCGDCELCIRSCPTKCIEMDRTLIADHCISYLTIEHKGILPIELRPLMNSWVYGCDLCQLVCPWNRKIIDEKMPGDQVSSDGLENMVPFKQINHFILENASFRPRRSTSVNILRNTAICLGNSHRREAIPILVQLFEKKELEIRAAAAWAIGEIKARESQAALRQQLDKEEENDVRIEIERALEKLA